MVQEGGQVGDYDVLELIGEGGMGRVFRARHLRTGRAAALKLRTPAETRDAEEELRFRREGQYMAQLTHPNVVKVYDVGQVDGQLWIAMEMLDGSSMADRIENQGKVQPALAARWVAEAARGLAALHDLSIAHRDIKPDNIMITAEGVVKVMDFGLAREAGATVLTAPGEMVGTPAYIAPETIAGSGDIRVDLWQLGVVLYLLLTAELPFEADTMDGYLTQVLKAPITPVKTHAPGCPVELVAICEHMLEKDPARRPPSMHAVADALSAVVECIETGASGARRRAAIPRPRASRAVASVPVEPTVSPVPLAIGVVLALAGVALGGAAIWRSRRPVPAVEAPDPGQSEVADAARAAAALLARGDRPEEQVLQVLGALARLGSRARSPANARVAVQALDLMVAAAETRWLTAGEGAPRAFALASPLAHEAGAWRSVTGPPGWRAHILSARFAAEIRSDLAAEAVTPLSELRRASDAGDAEAAAGLVDAYLAAGAAAWLADDRSGAEERYREALRLLPDDARDARALRAAIGQVETGMELRQQSTGGAMLTRARSALPRLAAVRATWEPGYRKRRESLAQELFSGDALHPAGR